MQFDEFIYDEGIIFDGPYYSLDALIEAIADPVEYSVDAVFGSLGQKTYSLTALINNDHATSSYQVDTVLVLDKHSQKFRESIINSIYVSCARACEDLSTAISEMGLRMQLSYASGSDLDLYWSKVLSLRRRFLESDEDYRTRLKARMTLMKSSGTESELLTLINTILGMQNAATLRTYWPAEIRVDWNSFAAMKQAELKYDRIKEALDEAVAAGVTWSTSFPYKEYLLDAALAGTKLIEYSVDTGISKEKETFYRIVVDLLNPGSKIYDVDAGLETRRSKAQLVDTKLLETNYLDYHVGSFIEGSKTKTYDIDLQLWSVRSKLDDLDVIMSKDRELIYDVDAFVARDKRGFYLLMVVIDE